jgi:hypothetical protein
VQNTQPYILNESGRANSRSIFPIGAYIKHWMRNVNRRPLPALFARLRRPAIENRGSVGRNNELGVGVTAHAIDSTGGASSDGISVAAGMLGSYGDGAI